MAKRILQLEGVNELEFNGKRIKGTELTLHLVYRNEFGVEVEFPLEVEHQLQINLTVAGPIQRIEHSSNCANMHITTTQTIDTVISTGTIHTDAPVITNLVADRVDLGNTTQIGTCYAGCAGAHINSRNNLITVGKSPRNPFIEGFRDKPLHRMTKQQQTLKRKANTIILPPE